MAVISEWAFSEGTGTSAAAETGGINATNVPGWHATGHTGPALLTGGGTGAQVAIPAGYAYSGSGVAPLDSFTWMTWIYVTAWPGEEGQFIFGPRYGGNGAWHLNVQANNRIGFWSGSSFIDTTGTISLNTWYHVAVTVEWLDASGNTDGIQIYLNGTLVGSQVGFPMTSGTVYLGGEPGQAPASRMDDVRFYSHKLTPAEVTTAMNTPVGGGAAPPVSTAGRWYYTGTAWLSMTTSVLQSPFEPPPSGGARLQSGYSYSVAEAAASSGITRLGLTEADMTLYTGPDVIPQGTTLYRQLITDTINIQAGGITLDQCLIRPTTASGWNVIMSTNWAAGTAPPTKNIIRDCEITGELLSTANQSLLLGVDGLTDVIGCNIHHLGSGIGVRQGNGSNYETFITSNWVHTLISFGDPAGSGNHCDGFTIRQFSGTFIYVNNNWFDCETANASGACFLQAQDPIANASFTSNLFAGGGWNLTLSTVTNAHYIDNRFLPTGWGAVDGNNSTAPVTWTDNHIYDGNATDAKGVAVSQP